MGIDIDLCKCNFKELKKAYMEKFPQIQDEDLLEKVLLEFGTVIGEDYVILCNEYYEDGNCFYNVSPVLEKVFKLPDDSDAFDILLAKRKEILSHKEEYEAYENLGIDPYEEDEEDEEEEDFFNFIKEHENDN